MSEPLSVDEQVVGPDLISTADIVVDDGPELAFNPPNDVDMRAGSCSTQRSVEGASTPAAGWKPVKALYCTDKLWVFVTPGLTLVVIGFLLCIIYFSIRALTTSLEYTETVPTYANALLVLCAGILTIAICKRRNKMLIVTMITMCVICSLVNTASGILTGIRNIQVMHSIEFCQYKPDRTKCDCYTYMPPYKPRNLTSWEISDPPEYVFYNAPSCEVINKNLIDFMYTQCGLYGGAVVMCTIAVILGVVVYRNERKRMRIFKAQQEQYNMCTIISNRSNERRCVQSVSAGLDNSDNASTSTGHTAPSLFSQRITFPGENQPRLLGIRRNDSIVRPVRNGGDTRNIPNEGGAENQYTSLPNLPSQTQEQEPPADSQQTEIQRANEENETRDRTSNRGRSNLTRSEGRNNLSQTLDSRQLTAMWGMFVRYLQQMGQPLPGQSLPDYPLHRGAAAEVFPNRPLSRSNQMELPPWPVSRNGSMPNNPLMTRSSHQNLGELRSRPSRNTVTSQRNTSLRDPPPPRSNMSFVHYMTGISNMVSYQVEPPPPYAQPPPYVENDTVPEYTSDSSTCAAETQMEQEPAENVSRQSSVTLTDETGSRDVVETVI